MPWMLIERMHQSSPISPDVSYPGWLEDGSASRVKVKQQCDPMYERHFAKREPRLDEAVLPTRLKLEKKIARGFGDLMMAPSRFVFVSERFKDAVEALEPGVHQFWRVRALALPKGMEPPGPIHGFRVCQMLRSVDFERSSHLEKRYTDDTPKTELPYSYKRHLSHEWGKDIVLRPGPWEDAHVWCDFISDAHLMISDALHDVAKAEKMKIWKAHRIRVAT